MQLNGKTLMHVPSVARPREPTDGQAGDLLRLGNASDRQNRLYAGLWLNGRLTGD